MTDQKKVLELLTDARVLPVIKLEGEFNAQACMFEHEGAYCLSICRRKSPDTKDIQIEVFALMKSDIPGEAAEAAFKQMIQSRRQEGTPMEEREEMREAAERN